MKIPDARGMEYVNLFKSQMGGGAISLLQGLPRYQCGKGFGDFFRGLLHLILPIAFNVGKLALSQMRDAQEQMASFKDTLKSAVRAATNAAIDGRISPLDRENQGSGHKRVAKHKTGYTTHKAKRTKPIIKNI